MEPRKELQMDIMQSPWGRVRVWSIREPGKVTPVQEIFWADEYQCRRFPRGNVGKSEVAKE